MAEMTTKILTVELQADKAINGIVSLNDAIGKNTQQIKDNNAMIAENNKAMKQEGADVMKLAAQNQKLSQSNAELEAKTKVLKDERRLLQKETQNEIRLQTQEQGSLRQLRAELSNLTKQYDSLSKAERENVNVGGKLKNQINQVTTEIKAAEEGTQRYYRNVGNYQNAILGALGVNNSFVASLVSMGGGSKDAGNMLDGMGGDAIRTTSALATLNIHAKALGKTLVGLATNPVFLAIAGIAGAGMAAKWFYDYNLGIEKALRLTREFTGLADSDLANLRAEIAATAETYGKDYKQVLETVDVIMSHYGKSGKEAIDIINAGFQSGADLNGNMLDKINQLSPAFKNAGVDVEQLVALISQTRSGIFSDKGLDAIVMGTSRIRQFSDSMRKALQGIGIDAEEMGRKLRTGELSPFAALTQISSKLKELSPNTQEYGKVMNEVFGKAGKTISTEMVQGLADMNTNLEELKKTTGEYGELTDQLREKERELQSAMADVFGTGEDGFENLTLQAKIYIKEGLIQIVKWLKEQVNWFKNVWNSTQSVRVVLAGFIGLWRTLAKVAYIPINLIITGLKTIGDILVALSNAFATIKKNIARAFEGLVEIFRGIKNLDPEQILRGVTQAATGAWDTVKAVGAGVADTFNATFGRVKDMAVDTASDIKDIWQDTFDISNYTFPTASPSGGGGKRKGKGIIQAATDIIEDALDTDTDTDTNGASPTGKNNKKGGASKKSATAKSEKSPAEIEKERQIKALQELQKKAQELEKKALDEEAKLSVEGIKKKYAEQEAAIRAAYGNLNMLTEEQQKEANAIMQKLLDENAKQQSLDIQAFYGNIRKQREEEQKVYEEQAKALVNASLETSQEGTDEWLKWRLEQLRIAMEAELLTVSNNSQLRNAIIAKYEQQATQIYAENAQAQVRIQQEKYDAIAGVVGGLGQAFGEFGDESREMAILQKTLALGEIMIAQAVAIANAVKAGSNAITPWQMIAQIATSVVAVTTAMAQAFKALDSAKFATGGYIRGAGTGTSDSIPVRVSNGESIMNANTTAMFSGLLSSLNQLGGGVPIQVAQTAQSVRGEDMLARAVARGVAMLPNPVVSVVDINNGQRQVEVMNERATL